MPMRERNKLAHSNRLDKDNVSSPTGMDFLTMNVKHFNRLHVSTRGALKLLLTAVIIASTQGASAFGIEQTKGDWQDKFRQLDEILPTPNDYRNAAGEPGRDYWQQQVDYTIDVTLDENKRSLTAEQTVVYHNNSPYTLRYIWVQLEQNRFKPDSVAETTEVFGGLGRRGPSTKAATDNDAAGISFAALRRQHYYADNDIGYKISNLRDENDKALPHIINGAQMRIDLATPIKSGESFTYKLDYAYNILEEDAVSARAGYEHFPDDARKGGNDIFLLAQWFPRVSAYSDYEAWHNKEFLGRGEFTLEFGNYDVSITVPADHIVSSSGVLQNPDDVLSNTQQRRLEKSKTAKRPVYIVTPEEALANEAEGTKKQKTWRFYAENVRDFAWASSRKFIWDARGFKQGGEVMPEVMAMSFYPKEGGELWEKYSTEAVIHTMEVYNRFAFDYPYPVAQSVNGPVGGMEYPMITFNGPRTIWHDDEELGEYRTYTLAEKRFLIGVVIHEIGHIYFPMLVNSDERQWTWMDEGINSFLDSIACREWDPNIPWGVEAYDIVDYMKSDIQVPIMTQSDSVLNLGPNAYTKPAVALNILREVVLGRELFDFAFKEYSRRWLFKRPTPSDFFRTMEEASGVDLDWFWRGWFYTTDHVDISIDKVSKLRLDTKDPDIDFERRRDEEADKPASIFVERNEQEGRRTWLELNKDISDFHDDKDKFYVTNKQRNDYQNMLAGLKPWERETLERAVKEDKHYYVAEFSNIGGLVMPILLSLHYENGKTEEMNIPAEIWRRYPKAVKKLIVTDKPLKSIEVDANWLTADVDTTNNHYPRQIVESRIEAFKSKKRDYGEYRDVMHDDKTELEDAEIKPYRK